ITFPIRNSRHCLQWLLHRLLSCIGVPQMNTQSPKRPLSVAGRLAIGFGLLLLMLLVLVAVSIAKVDSIESSLSRVSDVNNVKQRYAVNFRGSVHDRAIA